MMKIKKGGVRDFGGYKMFGYSKYKKINEWREKNGCESVIFDENFNILKRGKWVGRWWGTGDYNGIVFRCSKCGKQYNTYGALKFYHKKCLEVQKNGDKNSHTT